MSAITAAGNTAEAVAVDVRQHDDIERLAASVLNQHGRADILVNNVGHYLRPTAFRARSIAALSSTSWLVVP